MAPRTSQKKRSSPYPDKIKPKRLSKTKTLATYSSHSKHRLLSEESSSESDDSDNESYESVDDEGTFVSKKNDEKNLWEAKEIVGEKGQQYKIKWAGKNPETDKPWSDSWTHKTNVANNLARQWGKWKRLHGVPSKSKSPINKKEWLAKLRRDEEKVKSNAKLNGHKSKTTTKSKTNGSPRKPKSSASSPAKSPSKQRKR
ncbi:hypothetical protein DL96DRAFT_1685800 [Flagelloscypha sp. PMI_526]|nr:hypothetical protein DL96DRAFT_1685800 [Flagelloscypha sp. PMI_526]